MPDIDLGKLTLGSEIGAGGYGVVYEGRLDEIGHEVAVKVLEPSTFQGEAAKQRFIAEAKLLLSLRHQYIISVHGLGTHEGKPYIIMERFNGMDLYKACEKGRPTPEKVLDFMLMTTEALGYAHGFGVIHRDLKPSNLMTVRGDARVIDFGIAALLDREGERLTKKGGTPVGGAFAAPELVSDPRLLDPRTDIYSLAACWYWLLTGNCPQGRNWESQLTRLDGVSDSYSSVIFRGLEEIDNRYSSMDELRDEIRALRSGTRPKAQDELVGNDDVMLVLGAIYEKQELGDSGVASFELERQISHVLSKLKMKSALGKLERRGFIKSGEFSDWNNSYYGYEVLDEGRECVEENLERVEGLLKRAEPEPVQHNSDDDDVPF